MSENKDLENFEVTELEDQDLEDVAGGGLLGNDNCGCGNDNCGCGAETEIQ